MVVCHHADMRDCGCLSCHTGLMAWIVEKFRTWSDCGGDVESRFSKDELLTNVAI